MDVVLVSTNKQHAVADIAAGSFVSCKSGGKCFSPFFNKGVTKADINHLTPTGGLRPLPDIVSALRRHVGSSSPLLNFPEAAVRPNQTDL